MTYAIDDLKTKTLGEVNELYRRDAITEETARAYCELWNTSTFRFTVAKVVGQTIMQFNSDEVKWQ